IQHHRHPRARLAVRGVEHVRRQSPHANSSRLRGIFYSSRSPPTTTTMAPADRYPRDMIGYGGHPPHARWPGGARVAVQIVLNYEEGSENSVLHGDAASETFLSEIIGAQPFAMRHLSMESLYEYGSRAG